MAAGVGDGEEGREKTVPFVFSFEKDGMSSNGGQSPARWQERGVFRECGKPRLGIACLGFEQYLKG